MVSTDSYAGPLSLENSKYATSRPNEASCSTTSSSKADSPKRETVIATSEQITSVGNGTAPQRIKQHNLDTQLAIAHGNSLKEEVDKHMARLSGVLSTTGPNMRRLLELLREASSESKSAIFDALWQELNELFAAMNDAKAALPVLLEKQRNNVSLHHTAMIKEIIQNTQYGLDAQHKKASLQRDLILEHREAFQAYQEHTADKLKDIDALLERVSRPTLEKGNLRTEVDKYTQLLEKEQSSNAENTQKVYTLQKELQILMDSKKELLAKIDMLCKRLDDDKHADKLKVSKQYAEQCSVAELECITDQLAEEKEKTAALQTVISSLEGRERMATLDAGKAKKESKTLSEKYNEQAAEHAKVFTKFNEQAKEINGLKSDIERMQKENTALRQEVAKLAHTESQLTKFTQANSDLAEHITSLTDELKTAQDEVTKSKIELEALLKKVELLSKDVEHAHLNASPLVKQQAEKIAALETTLEEWTVLAKHSYQEYKEILPGYRQAEQYRKDALEKDRIIEELEKKLTSATASQSNEAAAIYWKSKYENLLDSVAQ